MASKGNFWYKLEENLNHIYSRTQTVFILAQLKKLLRGYSLRQGLSAKDLEPKISSSAIALITYASTIEDKKSRRKSLVALKEFIDGYHLDRVLKIVHLLPFYPWDTDRGFSVVDYYRVNPDYGSWKDIENLSQQARLMFDFVANHASINNPLVQKALIERHISKDDPRYPDYARYKDFVIVFSDKEKPSQEDLKKLVRPRPTPVLTRYTVYEIENPKSQVSITKQISNHKFKRELKAVLGDRSIKEDKNRRVKILGRGWVWTTFSRPKKKDGAENTRQVDLNYHNPKLFLEAVKILLFYSKKGASLIRLDAIRYLWKRLGFSSVDEEETHIVIQLWRVILSAVAPNLITVAEVNERQSLILPYLGKKSKLEADLVYQFTHFPLAIYTIINENNFYYLKWLKTLKEFKGRQFITVLGSHDGMGLKPLRDFLPQDEIEDFAQRLIDRGSLPNYAYLAGGKKIVYEVCSTPWNLINGQDEGEDFELKLARYLLVLGLGLSLRGLPAIYINGLLGAKNYYPKEGLDENRTVNREIFDKKKLFAELDNLQSHKGKVMKEVLRLLRIRSKEPAFDPLGKPLEIIDLKNPKLIAVVLESKNGDSKVLAVFNLSKEVQEIRDLRVISLLRSSKDVTLDGGLELYDLISKKRIKLEKEKNSFGAEDVLSLKLQPYQVLWLKFPDRDP